MATLLALKLMPMLPFKAMVFEIQRFPWKHSLFFSLCIIPMQGFASQRHHRKQPSLNGRPLIYYRDIIL